MSRNARRATGTCRVLAMLALCGAGQLARAQQSWSAYVIADSATVYAKMEASSDALASLPKGAAVTVYFAVQSVQGNWCSIVVKSERQRPRPGTVRRALGIRAHSAIRGNTKRCGARSCRNARKCCRN